MPTGYDPSPITEGFNRLGRGITEGIEGARERRREKAERFQRSLVANGPEFRDYQDLKDAIIDGTITIPSARVLASQRRKDEKDAEAAQQQRDVVKKLFKGDKSNETLESAATSGALTPAKALEVQAQGQEEKRLEGVADSKAMGFALEEVAKDPLAQFMAPDERQALARAKIGVNAPAQEDISRIYNKAKLAQNRQLASGAPEGTFATPFEAQVAQATGDMPSTRFTQQTDNRAAVRSAKINEGLARVNSPESIATTYAQAKKDYAQMTGGQTDDVSDKLFSDGLKSGDFTSFRKYSDAKAGSGGDLTLAGLFNRYMKRQEDSTRADVVFEDLGLKLIESAKTPEEQQDAVDLIQSLRDQVKSATERLDQLLQAIAQEGG